MFKHANTISEGDKVRVAAGSNGNVKTAGSTGTAREVDAGMELVKVEWNDGSVSFIDINQLEAEDK